MARAHRKRDRLKQIHACLCALYPTPYPTELRIRVRPGCPVDFGGCEWLGGRRIALYVNPRYSLPVCIDTLMHEYAHALVFPHARVAGYQPDHSASWGIRYAELLEAWTDGDLDRVSWGY